VRYGSTWNSTTLTLNQHKTYTSEYCIQWHSTCHNQNKNILTHEFLGFHSNVAEISVFLGCRMWHQSFRDAVLCCANFC
jgi:hypothetical protein